jgi:hypothetical protein
MMDNRYPQYGHSEAVHSQQYGVMPANPVTMGYFYPSYQPVPTFHENKVMFFDINHGIQSLAKKLVIWAFSLIKHPFSKGPGRL